TLIRRRHSPSVPLSLGSNELICLLSCARVSIHVVLASNAIAAVIVIDLGGTAAMAGTHLQTLLMRLVDVILSFPVLLLAIALLADTQPNVRTIVIIVGISFGAYLARVVFAHAVSLQERKFVLAARTAGVRIGWSLYL